MQKASEQKTTREESSRLQLSLVQVLAAVLASITSAVILSKFGVAGTYAGTAIGSAVSTVAVAVYSHTMRQARRRVSRYAEHRHAYLIRPRLEGSRANAAPTVTIPAAAWSSRHPATVAPVVRRRSSPQRSGWRARLERLERWFAGLPLWGKAGVTAAVTFLIAVTAVVLFQLVSGISLPNVWGIGTSSGPWDPGCVIGRCGGATPAPVQSPLFTPTTGTTAQPASPPTPAPATAPSPAGTPAVAPSMAPSVVPSTAVPPVPTSGP